jgi:hypothetical protein
MSFSLISLLFDDELFNFPNFHISEILVIVFRFRSCASRSDFAYIMDVNFHRRRSVVIIFIEYFSVGLSIGGAVRFDKNITRAPVRIEIKLAALYQPIAGPCPDLAVLFVENRDEFAFSRHNDILNDSFWFCGPDLAITSVKTENCNEENYRDYKRIKPSVHNNLLSYFC